MPDAAAYAYYLEALYEEVDYEIAVAALASIAVPDGLPDPSSAGYGGWAVGSQDAIPDTNVSADGANPNTFTDGQNVNPFTGIQNTSPFADDQNVNPDGGVSNFGWGPYNGAVADDGTFNMFAGQDVNPDTNMAAAVASPSVSVANGDQGEVVPISNTPVSHTFTVTYTGEDGVTHVTTIAPPPAAVTPPVPQTAQLTSDFLVQFINSDPFVQFINLTLGPGIFSPAAPGTAQSVVAAPPPAAPPTVQSPGPLSDPFWLGSGTPQTPSQPGIISQILSGTFADSVLQSQLLDNARQGPMTGSFVDSSPDHDYLWNPNATSLGEAMLLASHSPNTELLDARSLQLGASMTPVIGSVATWMNPHSGWFAKGMAGVTGVLSVVPLGSELTELGELGSLSAEGGAALGEEAGTLPELSELGEFGGQRATIQDIQNLLQELKEADIQVISVKGANEWTQLENEALFEYNRVYQETGSFTKAGDAFHDALGAASGGTTGPDRIDFNFVNEIKTSAGHPDLGDFTDALEQAEGHAVDGLYDGAVVTVYDMLNGVKYFVQRAP